MWKETQFFLIGYLNCGTVSIQRLKVKILFDSFVVVFCYFCFFTFFLREQLIDFMNDVAALKHVKLHRIDMYSPEALCFFVNVFHTLLLHARLLLLPPNKQVHLWPAFFQLFFSSSQCFKWILLNYYWILCTVRIYLLFRFIISTRWLSTVCIFSYIQNWAAWFSSVSYEIGDDVFSLAELEHCVIRGERPLSFVRSPFSMDFLSQYCKHQH